MGIGQEVHDELVCYVSELANVTTLEAPLLLPFL